MKSEKSDDSVTGTPSELQAGKLNRSSAIGINIDAFNRVFVDLEYENDPVKVRILCEIKLEKK
jgi:hypothetical protein